MAKAKGKQTPQEIYWERKRHEEEEKDAHLPPGLLNQGNTCFMNSTLQGLIASRPLRDLMYLQPVFPSIQGSSIVARRSPQLMNGHGYGGPHEQDWTEGMPLGDIFTTIMRKAWDTQDAKRRESMNPKEILTTIGRKYDQYLDFRQQDAHEFLRHMLDVMRMEELDIIKKRQPPPSKSKRQQAHRNTSNGTPLIPSNTPPSTPPAFPVASPRRGGDSPLPPELQSEEKLESFVDMLFGGQLASILVCEKCKKVSVTHEDFNDLSLSIKPEDYVKGRRRDRIKKIARKFRIRPPNSSIAQDVTGLGALRGMQRASSMPASPVRRSTEVPPREEEPPTSEDPRRRSYDHPGEGEEDEARDVVNVMPSPPAELAVPEEQEQPTEDVAAGQSEGTEQVAEGSKPDELSKVEVEPHNVVEGGEREKLTKEKDRDDAWGKLARRISVSMKLGGSRDKDSSRPSSRAGERGRNLTPREAIRVRGDTRSPRTTSLARSAAMSEPPLSDSGDVSDAGRSQALPPVPVPVSPQLLPTLAEDTRPRNSRRTTANLFKPRHHHHHHHHVQKSPLPPKMSEMEILFLRKLLADVHPVTGNPLAMIQHALAGGGGGMVGGPAALATQALWAKLGHLPGIEECLRMFTAVEILDGENMVGCHRCWKIANGTYTPYVRDNGDIAPGNGSDSDSEASDDASDKSDQGTSLSPSPTNPPGLSDIEDSPAISSPNPSSGRVSPASMSGVSLMAAEVSSKSDDRGSISSAPTTIMESLSPLYQPLAHTRKDGTPPVSLSTFGGLPIPQISTTEVDLIELGSHGPPISDEKSRTWSSTRAVMELSFSNDSLLQPKRRRRGRPRGTKKDDGNESGSTSEDEYDSASDTSAPASGGSDGSASPFVSPRSSVEKLPDTQLSSRLSSPKLGPQPTLRSQDNKIARSQQVIMRRMYKRYLISTPPPILVIHLKRFQHTSKMQTVSLSGGFTKLDDFVSYPEYLDLAPFLAPKRADFTPGKEKGKHKHHQERCMYRLYAVVVHIGNMLGGHYIAYTALPPASPAGAPTTPSSEAEKSVPSTPPASAPLAHDHRTSVSSDAQRQPRQWAYINDAVVKLTTLEEVLKAKAYICMYERI